MKKFIIPLFIAFVLTTTGCFMADTTEDTATVRITFSGSPVAHNVQHKTFMDSIRSFFIKDAYATTSYPVYIAAVKGNETLTVISTNTQEIIQNANSIIMQVPEGDGITVFGLLYYNSKYYYGNATVNLKAGEVSNVIINIASTLEAAIGFSNTLTACTWTAIQGAAEYVLQGLYGTWSDYPGYDGVDTDLPVSGYTDYRVSVYFECFNLTCGPYQ